MGDQEDFYNESNILMFQTPKSKSKLPKLTKLTSRLSPLQQKILRAIGTFLITFLVMLNYTKLAMNVNWLIASISSLIFASICSISVTFSIKTRSILLLCIPEVFSRSGLIIASTILYWLASSGPINNIIHNLGEINGMINCNQAQIQMQQMQFLQAINEVNDESVRKIIRAITKATDTFSGISGAIGTVTGAINNVENTVQKFSDENLKISQENCNVYLKRAFGDCNSAVDQAYNQCRNALRINGRKKRSPFFNDIVNSINNHVVKPVSNGANTAINAVSSGTNTAINAVSSGTNTAINAVSSGTNTAIRETGNGIGTGINAVTGGINHATTGVCSVIQVGKICSAINSLNLCDNILGGIRNVASKVRFDKFLTDFKEMFDIRVDVSKRQTSMTSSTLNLTEIKIKIREGINENVENVQFYRSIFGYFIPITLFFLVIKASVFLKRYLKEKNSEEAKRAKKNDKTNWVIIFKYSMVSILIPLLTFGPILIFDFVLSTSLNWYKENINGTFTVEGGLDFSSRVEGGIILKPFFKSFLDDVQLKSEFNFEASNESCLPMPQQSDTLVAFIQFGITIGVMGILSFLGQYLLAYRTRLLNWVYQS